MAAIESNLIKFLQKSRFYIIERKYMDKSVKQLNAFF